MSAKMLSFTRRLSFPKVLSCNHVFTMRTISTKPTNLRRSYLYVPTSSDRMLEKSIASGSDVIIYDLEDSVSPAPLDKANARNRLKKFLAVRSVSKKLKVA